MKRKFALFVLFALLAASLNTAPVSAHSHSNASAVIVSTVAGIAAGVAIGTAVSSNNYSYRHQRRYKPYHHHKAGCVCCYRPVYVNTYPNYAYPAYVNYAHYR